MKTPGQFSAKINITPVPSLFENGYEARAHAGSVRCRASLAVYDVVGGVGAQAACMMPSAIRAALVKRERRVAAETGWL